MQALIIAIPLLYTFSNLSSTAAYKMEALCASNFGVHRDVLQFRTLDKKPVCETPTDVVIRVVYTELNPVDLHKLRGSPQQEGQAITNAPFIPGYGGSGVVEEVGKEAPSSLKGNRVAFMADPSRKGSYATYIAVDHRLVAEIPSDRISLKDAATVPLAGCTAYESLFKLGLGKDTVVSDDATFLVVGGAGGVGSWAISLAKAWHSNLKVIATGSSQASKEWCTGRGADQVLSHEEILDTLGGGREGSVSHILCLTEPTPSLFGKLSDLIQPYGTICLVVAGASIKGLDLGFCFFKAANVVMETVFTSIRTNFKSTVPSKEIVEILELLFTETLKAPLSPQQESAEGERDWKGAMEAGGILDILAVGHTRGKLILKIGSD